MRGRPEGLVVIRNVQDFDKQVGGDCEEVDKWGDEEFDKGGADARCEDVGGEGEGVFARGGVEESDVLREGVEEGVEVVEGGGSAAGEEVD